MSSLTVLRFNASLHVQGECHPEGASVDGQENRTDREYGRRNLKPRAGVRSRNQPRVQDRQRGDEHQDWDRDRQDKRLDQSRLVRKVAVPDDVHSRAGRSYREVQHDVPVSPTLALDLAASAVSARAAP